MNVAIIYHMFPHYRQAIVEELQKSTRIKYTFVGNDKNQDGVKRIPKEIFNNFIEAPYKIINGLYIQPKIILIALSPKYDAIILLGNPNFLTTWIAAIIARATGKKLIYWTHGWLSRETGIKAAVRNTYYRIANTVLTYNETAISQAKINGYKKDNIYAVYNSLDTKKSEEIYQELLKSPQKPIKQIEFVCIARLTAACKFDLLIKAAHILDKQGEHTHITLIGDGPERLNIESIAKNLGVNLSLIGECYDEALIGKYIYNACATVSPGKIGLTAMHSLIFGTPIITHDNIYNQMPEHESIINEITGSLFKENDCDDLAQKMLYWAKNNNRNSTRDHCRDVIYQKWNPSTQAKIIEHHLLNN